MLVYQPPFQRASQFGQFLPARSCVERKVALNSAASVSAGEHKAVLAQGNALNLDEGALEVIPSKGSDALGTTPKCTRVIIAESALQSLAHERHSANLSDFRQTCGTPWPGDGG
jgi:hypothetical protein